MERIIASVSVAKLKNKGKENQEDKFVLRLGTEAFSMDTIQAEKLCFMFATQLGYVMHKRESANENSTKDKPLGV